MVIGGALGNLTDRIFRGPGFLDGKVIDWIQVPYWPTFNIADSGGQHRHRRASPRFDCARVNESG